MEALIIFVGGAALVALLLVVGTLWRGFVLHILWGWFMVPIFGLPALSVVAAIGVSLVVSFMTFQYVYAKDDRETAAKIGSVFGITVLYPALVLGIGYVVKSFM